LAAIASAVVTDRLAADDARILGMVYAAAVQVHFHVLTVIKVKVGRRFADVPHVHIQWVGAAIQDGTDSQFHGGFLWFFGGVDLFQHLTIPPAPELHHIAVACIDDDGGL